MNKIEERKALLLATKGGSGSSTFRATLPNSWIRKMGLDEESKKIVLKFDGEKISIEKESDLKKEGS